MFPGKDLETQYKNATREVELALKNLHFAKELGLGKERVEALETALQEKYRIANDIFTQMKIQKSKE